ncbi:MAG TPA: 5'-methylthioadenosine/adenosylhomocysteine nucleosidase [Firmicutes bacterium]|nr:5'-methylthioadenosine/adenosylhomocysteine nucleosidase [Bacillota bacterium]
MGNNYIAIIGAMAEEIELLTPKLADLKKLSVPFTDLPLFSGRLGNKNIVVARCGIGKVNAAAAAQYLIDQFPLRALINTGIAGGLGEKVLIGDLVVSRAAVQHDVDCRNLAYPKGTIPRLATSVFPSAESLAKLAAQTAKEVLGPGKVHHGLIASGDQFVSSLEQKRAILNHFPTALCVEMEGAAIAQVAYLNQIPHLILRIISDQADNTAPADLAEYLKIVLPRLNDIIIGLLKQL